MRAQVALLAALLSVTITARTGQVPLSKLRPTVLLTLRSYGERSSELVDLLVPFFATRHFQLDRPRTVLLDGTVISVFAANIDAGREAQFDAIVATGPFNNLTVAYCEWPTPNWRSGANGPGRALAFADALYAFLKSLPYPKVAVTDNVVKKSQKCSDAF